MTEITEREKVSMRSAAAFKAANTKREKLFNQIEEAKIEVIIVPTQEVLQAAIDDYNNATYDDGKSRRERDGFRASIYSNEDFLERICTNYIRHNLTNYEEILSYLRGKVGKREAYEYTLRPRVDLAIEEKYPNLLEDIMDARPIIEERQARQAESERARDHEKLVRRYTVINAIKSSPFFEAVGDTGGPFYSKTRTRQLLRLGLRLGCEDFEKLKLRPEKTEIDDHGKPKHYYSQSRINALVSAVRAVLLTGTSLNSTGPTTDDEDQRP